MDITHDYLIRMGFMTSVDDNHLYYNKNGFIVCRNALGLWEQCHDFGVAAGFGVNGTTFENAEQLESKYLRDVGSNIDED